MLDILLISCKKVIKMYTKLKQNADDLWYVYIIKHLKVQFFYTIQRDKRLFFEYRAEFDNAVSGMRVQRRRFVNFQL